MVTLETERLILRELTLDDAEALNAVDGDPVVARWNGFEPPDLEGTRGYIASVIDAAGQSPRQFYTLALVTRTDNRLIGRCGIDRGGPDLLDGMVGYCVHRDLWGQGYMTEAVRELVDFGFRELKLHRMWADCDPRNIGSWRVMEKVGMRREGHAIENYRYPDGEWADTWFYAILNREWAARASQPLP
jgi:RimJ/RimL family protein N-acetyltransferase